MSAAVVAKRCPNCWGSVAPTKRGHAVFCRARCRQAASARGRRFEKRLAASRGRRPRPSDWVKHAVCDVFAQGWRFDHQHAAEAVRHWGHQLEGGDVALWLTAMVDAGLLEASGEPGRVVFWLPRATAPKRGCTWPQARAPTQATLSSTGRTTRAVSRMGPSVTRRSTTPSVKSCRCLRSWSLAAPCPCSGH